MINFAAQVSSSVFSLAAIWIFTRYLSAAEYGHFALLLASSLFIYPFLFTWLRVGVLRSQSATPTLDLRKTMLSAIGLIFIAALLVFFVYFQFYNFTLMDKIFLILMTLFLGLAEIITENMRNKQATKIVAVAVFMRALIYPVVGIILVVALNFTSEALFIAFILSLIGNCLVFYRYILERPYAKADKILLKQWLLGAGIVTFSAFIFSLNATLDRFALAHFFTLKEVGEYATSSLLVKQIFMALTASVVAAFVPRAIELYNKPESRGELKSHMTQGLELLLAISLPLSLACLELAPAFAQYFLGESFRAAAYLVIPMVGLGALFSTLSQNFLHASFHFKNIYWPIALSACLTLFFNLIALFLLGRKGIEGVAQAFFISEVLAFCCTYFLANHFHALSLFNAKIMGFIAANLLIFYGLGLLLPRFDSLGLLVTFSFGLAILEFALFYALNFFQMRSLLKPISL